MMKTFYASQNNLKQHRNSVTRLINQALFHFEQGTLFVGQTGDHWADVAADGSVLQCSVGKFRLDNGKGAMGEPLTKTTPRIVQVQSPSKDTLAIHITTGRDYSIKAYCSRDLNRLDCFVVEAFWKQGSEDLGVMTITSSAPLHKAA